MHLPDEVLGLVLKDLDLVTRLEAHQIFKTWHRLLTHDCSPGTWHDLITLDAHDYQMTPPCWRAWRQRMVWLADRAGGISVLHLTTDKWQNAMPGAFHRSEARCVFEDHLPYLIGRMNFLLKAFKLALKTGTE